MNAALLGMGLQAAGGLFAGRSRKKAAQEQQRMVIGMADDAVKARVLDQQDAIRLAREDEARLKGMQGVDLELLRRDARKAGFNPLTVLGATGGAGYGRSEAFISTPFLGAAEAFYNRTQAVAGTGQPLIDNAGYFGDAVAGFGSNLIGLSEQAAQRRHEMALLQAEIYGKTMARTATGGYTGGGGRGSSTPFMGADKVSLSPIRGVAPLGYDLERNKQDPDYRTAFNFPEFKRGQASDRPEKINPVQNEVWYKNINFGGEELIGWNDEAGDNELAAGFWIATWPLQWAGAKALKMHDAEQMRRAARASVPNKVRNPWTYGPRAPNAIERAWSWIPDFSKGGLSDRAN